MKNLFMDWKSSQTAIHTKKQTDRHTKVHTRVYVHIHSIFSSSLDRIKEGVRIFRVSQMRCYRRSTGLALTLMRNSV
jgi:hypothetical protein